MLNRPSVDPWAPRRRAAEPGVASDLRRGLVAAWRLASGRADAVAALFTEPVSPDAVARIAVRSFAALAFCLAPLAIIEASPIHLGIVAKPYWHAVTADLLSELASWLGFLAAVHAIAARRGVGAAWPRFVALWNWSNLTQAALLAVAVVPVWLPVPAVFDVAIRLIFVGWAVMVEWVAIKLSLGLSRAITTALVALNVTLQFALDGVVAALSN